MTSPSSLRWRARRPLPACLAFVSLTLLQGAAQAQIQPDGQWHGGFSLGGSAASGNTEAQSLAVTVEAVRDRVADKISLNGLLNYGNSTVDGVKTRSAELARGTGRYDYNLSLRTFVFVGGEGERNRPGGLDSRYSLNGGAGYHLYRSERTIFDVFAGVGYSDAKFTDGVQRNGVEGLFGEESSHRLSETATFKQRLAIYPGTSELGTRATFDASLSAAISGGWTVNTGLAVRYNKDIAPGLKTTDSLLTFGFGYKF